MPPRRVPRRTGRLLIVAGAVGVLAIAIVALTARDEGVAGASELVPTSLGELAVPRPDGGEMGAPPRSPSEPTAALGSRTTAPTPATRVSFPERPLPDARLRYYEHLLYRGARDPAAVEDEASRVLANPAEPMARKLAALRACNALLGDRALPYFERVLGTDPALLGEEAKGLQAAALSLVCNQSRNSVSFRALLSSVALDVGGPLGDQERLRAVRAFADHASRAELVELLSRELPDEGRRILEDALVETTATVVSRAPPEEPPD